MKRVDAVERDDRDDVAGRVAAVEEVRVAISRSRPMKFNDGPTMARF
jgi:hypothetical protein